YFFSSKLKTEDGEDVSSKMVKDKIKELILNEEKGSPLSDMRITEILNKEHGIKVSRRAVAKYREQMGVLASYLRKEKI
ncbi:MAG: RNA polymerase sigma-54 factor, partial [bacterium]|nr:RNA polymerase sigma-54 factor [bacterium]